VGLVRTKKKAKKATKQAYRVVVFHPSDRDQDFIMELRSWSPTEAEMDAADANPRRYCRVMKKADLEREKAGKLKVGTPARVARRGRPPRE
jgi:hypothetical protein